LCEGGVLESTLGKRNRKNTLLISAESLHRYCAPVSVQSSVQIGAPYCIYKNCSIRSTIPSMRIDELNGLEGPKYTVNELGDRYKSQDHRKAISKRTRSFQIGIRQEAALHIVQRVDSFGRHSRERFCAPRRAKRNSPSPEGNHRGKLPAGQLSAGQLASD
jgi:hypothetical protein